MGCFKLVLSFLIVFCLISGLYGENKPRGEEITPKRKEINQKNKTVAENVPNVEGVTVKSKGVTSKSINVDLDSRVLTTNSDLNEFRKKDTTDVKDRRSFSSKSWNSKLNSKLDIASNVELVNQIIKKLNNQKCKQDILFLLGSVIGNEKWALEIFDSTAKFPSGLLEGNLYQLGSFDECLKANPPTNFTGQYCLADVHLRFKDKFHGNNTIWKRSDDNENQQKYRLRFNPNIYHWAVCLPSTCDTNDIAILMKEVFSLVDNFKTINVTVTKDHCVSKKEQKVTTSEIVYGSIIGIYLCFVIFATLLHTWILTIRKNCAVYSIDSIRIKKNSMLKESILSFSILKTVKNFLHVKPNELNLECIGGIKVLSMMVIVAGHSLIFIFAGPVANTVFFDEAYTKFQNGMLLNGPLLVDTFLFISGFLMCRLLLLELEKRNGKINFLLLYVLRYIRLTPSYLVVLGFYITWMSKLGNGPLWNDVIVKEADRCQESWWTNLLYVNNYVKTDHLCMFQSWYLAVDYHLFIIAPLIIYPLWKWKMFGKSLLVASLIAAVVYRFYVTYVNDLDPTLLAFPPETTDLSTNYYFVNYYIKSHLRGISYVIGLFFGYLVHRMQSAEYKIPIILTWLGWPITFIFGVGSMYSVIGFYDKNHISDALENAFYASLHSLGWSLAIGWVVLLCITENAGFVNKFLSWKVFIPLSRLTYCAYLVNGFIVLYNKGVLREPVYLSIYELTCKVMGHIVLTFCGAFILCVLFESPIHGLEKILLKRAIRKEEINRTVLSRPEYGYKE